MGILLLTSGDELLLQDGVSGLLLNQSDVPGVPGCVDLTVSVPTVVVSWAAPSATVAWAVPHVTITVEEC